MLSSTDIASCSLRIDFGVLGWRSTPWLEGVELENIILEQKPFKEKEEWKSEGKVKGGGEEESACRGFLACVNFSEGGVIVSRRDLRSELRLPQRLLGDLIALTSVVLKLTFGEDDPRSVELAVVLEAKVVEVREVGVLTAFSPPLFFLVCRELQLFSLS